MLNKIFNFISSLKLSIYLTISGALYYFFLSIWGYTSPPFMVQNIGKMLIFKILFILIILNNFFCIIRRLPSLIKETSRSPVFLPENYDWAGEFKGEGVEKFILKRRFSSLGTILLHLSLFFILLGFYLSSQSRREGKFYLAEGEELLLKEEDIVQVSEAGNLSSNFPLFKIKCEKVNYQFWGEKLLFRELQANLKIDEKNASIKINKIYLLNFSNFLRITSFGYAPSYMLVIKDYPYPIEEGGIKIFLFPPDKVESFKTNHFPHKFFLSLYPDFEERDGKYTSKSMQLKNPRLFVRVYRGKIFLKEALLSLGEPMEVEELTIAFLNIFPILEVTIFQDKGIFIIIFSFILFLSGLILRVRGKRGEILIRKEGEIFKIYGKNEGEEKWTSHHI